MRTWGEVAEATRLLEARRAWRLPQLPSPPLVQLPRAFQVGAGVPGSHWCAARGAAPQQWSAPLCETS